MWPRTGCARGPGPGQPRSVAGKPSMSVWGRRGNRGSGWGGSKPRVSTTDAEARVMKMPDGGYRPAFNLEIATDVDSQVIVGVGVETKGSDRGEAVPMGRQGEEGKGESPEGVL